MTQFRKKVKIDILYVLILIVSTLFIIFLLTRNQYIFGSTIDWINQHSIIPDYFRNLFYETKVLFPEFAPHLGGGQNIFHFSYYGYLNPIILLSYCFPMISMSDYIAFSSIALLLASGILCYHWLRKQCLSPFIAFTAAFLFQFSTPLLYHSHKQIMFVNYMPFLLLALLGVDIYFEKKKSFLLIFSTFLMINTSYFFSVGGLIVITIYAIYHFYQKNPSCTWKNFWKTGCAFALRLIIPIGISAFLLFPSLSAILTGRAKDTQNNSISILQLFCPKLILENIVYSPYGIGLTAISLFSLFYFLRKKELASKILAGLISVFLLIPFFLFLLNGGLYLRGKVFIPFLPLMTLMVGSFLEDCKKAIYSTPLPSLHYFIFVLIALILFDHTLLSLAFFMEGSIFLICYALAFFKKSISYLCFPTMILCFFICIGVNFSDNLISKEEAEEINNPMVKELVNIAMSKDDTSLSRINILDYQKENVNHVFHPKAYLTSLYSSTYSSAYNEFHKNLIGNADSSSNAIACQDSNNILFQTFMGIKYFITKEQPPIGYQKIAQKGEYTLYENENVFPIAYASSAVMGKQTFEKLSSAQKQLALLTHIQVEKAKDFDYTSPLIEEELKLSFPKDNISNSYSVINQTNTTLPIAKPFQNKIQLLEFHLKETSKEDIFIHANGITNRLTGKEDIYPNQNFDFHYVLSSTEPIKKIDLSFSAGNYHLFSPHLYCFDYQLLMDTYQNLNPLIGSELGCKNNILKGTIQVQEDGYFTVSIPYDKGFTAYVDGIKQPIETVNTAFMGFPITKGNHTIEIKYHAPFFALGKLFSLSFFLVFIFILILETPIEEKILKTPEKKKELIHVSF